MACGVRILKCFDRNSFGYLDLDWVDYAGEDILVRIFKLVGVSRVAHRWKTCGGF